MSMDNTKRIYIIVRKDNGAYIEAYDNLIQVRAMQRHIRVETEVIMKEFTADSNACRI